MSEQTGRREKLPQDVRSPGVPAPADYTSRRPRGMGGSALGLIALGVGGAVIGAVVLGPVIGTQLRLGSAQPAASTAGGPAPTAPSTGTAGMPAVSITPTNPSGANSPVTSPGLTPGGPAGTLPGATGTDDLANGASGAAPGLTTDPPASIRKFPHEQMGPPLPPELAARRARERFEEVGMTPPQTNLPLPSGATDPRLRGLEGSMPPLDRTARPPRLTGDPLGPLTEPAPREPGTTAQPTTSPRSTEPSPLATAPNLSPTRTTAPSSPTATAPPVSVPVSPSVANPSVPPVAVGPTPTPAPSRMKPAAAVAHGKYRYRVRVGEFATESAAHKYRRQMFQATGRGAEVVPDGAGFRLEVGAYENSVAAERVADELRAHNYKVEVTEPKATGAAPKE